MMIDWKPIETAPLRRYVLVFRFGAAAPVAVYANKVRDLEGFTHWAEFNLPEPGVAPTFVQRYDNNEGFLSILQALDEELGRIRGEIAELRARGEGRGNARS